MTPRTLTDAAAAPSALTAFLRGVERRAAVFAQLHCGDADAGDNALAGAMRAFRNAAERTPVADWPRRFWSLLLATPQLRQPLRAPHWSAGLEGLGRLGVGPRAALLLRLAAGLAEADAAAVLGIARPSYRLALQRALPHDADGRPDAQRWRQLGKAVQQATRQLPAERLAHLAKLREAAIQGRRLEHAPASRVRRRWRMQHAPASTRPARRWLLRVLWGALALCAFGFAATYFLPEALDRIGRDDDAQRIRVRALPRAEAPAATFAADTAMLTHRDFEQLLAATGADAGVESMVRDLDFFAWYAARNPEQDGTRPPPSAPAWDTTKQLQADAVDTPLATDAGSETSDAPW